MDLNTFTDNFELLADAPNGIPKLREMILQLAVRGKLVPQDPNDEPASVLLKKIAAEKERLISEGKLKKSKTFQPVYQDKVPYDLPEGWGWVKFGSLQEFTNGYAFPSAAYDNKGIGIVRIGDLQNGVISTMEMKQVPLSYLDELDKKLQVKPGDLLIAMSGATTGKLAFNRTSETFLLNQRVGKINLFLIESMYTYLFLSTKIKENLSISAGSAIPNLSTTQINNMCFPLPPLAEQKRIVTKVNELMALCDELEEGKKRRKQVSVSMNSACLYKLTSPAPATSQKGWSRIRQNFNLLYDTPDNVAALRKSILQLAVMGKLVPQDPNDEPASVLLEKIAKEKARLIKEGKIKKQKPLPKIADNEKPFELPVGWEWARLQEAIDVRDGTHDSPKDAIGPDTYPLVTSKNFYNGTIKFDEARRISAGDHFNISKRSLVERYDILFSMIGGNLGNQIMVDDDRTFSVKNVALFKYYDRKLTSPFFIKKFMEHLALDLQAKAAGGAQPFVSLGFLRNLVIAIPPIEEQRRIVAMVDGLIAICNTLKARLNDAQTIQAQLADAIVEQAVA
jgi:type I restriction enzyme, S subunit